MKYIIAAALALSLISVPSTAQTVSVPSPSSVGVSLPGQVPATQTNSVTCSTCVGYQLSVFVPASLATVCPTSGVIGNIGTVTLLPGNWRVDGSVTSIATTLVTEQLSGISSTSLAFDDTIYRTYLYPAAAQLASAPTPPRFYSVSANTPIYLVIRSTYTGTCTLGGELVATRIN